MNVARYRKAIAATLGSAATVAVTIPPDTPLWRTAQVVLALATIAGVTAVRNAPAAPAADPTVERPPPEQYIPSGGYPSGSTPADQLKPPSQGTRPSG